MTVLMYYCKRIYCTIINNFERYTCIIISTHLFAAPIVRVSLLHIIKLVWIVVGSVWSCALGMEYIYNYNCIELHIGVYTYNHY